MTEGFSRSVALPYLDTKNYLILFLLWPFLACITAILNFGQKEARNIVYAFLVYYGLTFVVGNEGIDASRIAMALKMNAMLPFSDIFRIIGGVYATDTTVDIVEPLISFVVSRITEDHRLLFGTFAALFGYFYVRSLSLLFDEAKYNFGWNSLIYMIFLASILPVTSINGFLQPETASANPTDLIINHPQAIHTKTVFIISNSQGLPSLSSINCF